MAWTAATCLLTRLGDAALRGTKALGAATLGGGKAIARRFYGAADWTELRANNAALRGQGVNVTESRRTGRLVKR